MIASAGTPRLAGMMAPRSLADFDLPRPHASWPMSAFLLETKSTAFAARNRIIHGQKNAEGLPGGSDTDAAIQEALDYAYASFDREWAAWASAQES